MENKWNEAFCLRKFCFSYQIKSQNMSSVKTSIIKLGPSRDVCYST
jgi:hypothetical protein